nr:hypothetical protein [Gluconobacter kondonii]
MAKALASGDERLMQKTGLEAELARLERLQAAHHDDQYNVRRAIERAERDRETAQAVIPRLQNDIARREPTRGEAFRLVRKDRETSPVGLVSRIENALLRFEGKRREITQLTTAIALFSDTQERRVVS